MIFHRLALRFILHKDDIGFYKIMGLDTVRWLVDNVELKPGARVLDLGTGYGVVGGELSRRGFAVTFADCEDSLIAEYAGVELELFDIERVDFSELDEYDLVVLSNVFEHLSRPEEFAGRADQLLKPGGMLYLAWTNWLSPWGGHDFSPFHYLGPRLGPRVYDRLFSRRRILNPYENLFPTSIGATLRMIRRNRSLRIVKVFPRYYPGAAFITRIPILREFLTWNCVILIERVRGARSLSAPTSL
jgi:SAM-dependent methyltransferase